MMKNKIKGAMSEKRAVVREMPAILLPPIISAAGYHQGIPVPGKTGDTCTGKRYRPGISGSSGGQLLKKVIFLQVYHREGWGI
jgi:hypothetical protein